MLLSNRAKQARRTYMREYQRVYMKLWRARNPAKVAGIQQRYWEKKVAQVEADALSISNQEESVIGEQSKRGCLPATPRKR